jgi:arsenical pump membrane protein
VPFVTALCLLAGVLGFAVARPARLPEALVAVPAAAVAVATHLVPWRVAGEELAALAPTVGFLAAVLVLAHLADAEGVFRYAGAVAARCGRGTPTRLLGVVFAIAALVTAVLSLDATVVLLTPVVFAAAAASGSHARPYVYACTHLANSASLLLPVSNLTNLLAFAATGLSFAGFAGLMALPWLAVIAVEYLLFRMFFARDLAAPPSPSGPDQAAVPWYALGVLGATLAGFAVAGLFGVQPVWVALAGALVLAAPRIARAPRTTLVLLREANPAFCVFVFALGVVVLGVRRHGLDSFLARLTPHHADLLGLLAAAALAAVLANLVNNLPATLVLVPAVAHSPGLVLAVLLGVNVGPNLSYTGSLATLLWRRILHARDARPATGEFLRLGAVTVPACLVVGTAILWAVLQARSVGWAV